MPIEMNVEVIHNEKMARKYIGIVLMRRHVGFISRARGRQRRRRRRRIEREEEKALLFALDYVDLIILLCC